jgi:hypothetical protein
MVSNCSGLLEFPGTGEAASACGTAFWDFGNLDAKLFTPGDVGRLNAKLPMNTDNKSKIEIQYLYFISLQPFCDQ